MRITAVECIGLEAPLRQPFGFSQAWIAKRRAALVHLETAEGLEGWGEIYCQVPPVVYTTLVAELLAPRLLGTDPWDRDVLWQRLYNATIDCGQRGLVVAALSGVDVAMWDLVGKDAGRPVHQLLGGLARPRVDAYATGLYRVEGDGWLAALVAEARGHVDAGFRTLKMKVGFGLERDIAAVHRVRETIGPDVALAIDANHAYKPVQAIALGRALTDQRLAWFEEPVSPEDIEGYREVRERQPVPVAGGELAYTRYGFRDLLTTRALDILQPEIGLCGGLSEARAIADLARAWNVRCWPHVWGTGIAQAVALHFLGWLPNESALEPVDPPLLEWDLTENPLREEVVPDRPRMQDGSVAVPLGPGLGITVDRQALARYQVAAARVA